MTETELTEALTAQDPEALAELQRRFGAYCAAIIGGILADPADVEEVLGDVWMQVWSSIPPNRPDHLRLYVGRIARNRALNRLDYLRSEKRGQPALALEELSDTVPDRAETINPDRQALKDAMERFLGTLKSEYRRMFLRRYWYGDSVAQIADRFGCSVARVTGILFRVRKQLKEFLKKEDLDYGSS